MPVFSLRPNTTPYGAVDRDADVAIHLAALCLSGRRVVAELKFPQKHHLLLAGGRFLRVKEFVWSLCQGWGLPAVSNGNEPVWVTGDQPFRQIVEADALAELGLADICRKRHQPDVEPIHALRDGINVAPRGIA